MSEVDVVHINSAAELINKMKDEKINNLLIGNGFSLSHPKLGESFNWDMHQALDASWADMLHKQSKSCPERDLSTIRVNITKKILKYYIDGLRERIPPVSENLCQLFEQYLSQIRYTCSNFLSLPSLQGGNIFTLNYDPLLYWEILKLLIKENPIHFDGFITSKDNGGDGCITQHPNPSNPFLSQDYLKCKLDGKSCKIKILYLHGSWFILANNNDELKKLSFRTGGVETVDSLFENDQRPFLILEDRWRTKEAILKADPYLQFCHEQLGKIGGNLLIFGCAFNNDDHILNTIKSNSLLKEIFVTFRTEDDKRKLEDKFTGLEEKVKYLQISKNVIWEEIT